MTNYEMYLYAILSIDLTRLEQSYGTCFKTGFYLLYIYLLKEMRSTLVTRMANDKARQDLLSPSRPIYSTSATL